MKTEQIIILVVAFFLGMLLLNTIKNVCGCDLLEGQAVDSAVDCYDENVIRNQFNICNSGYIDSNPGVTPSTKIRTELDLGDAGVQDFTGYTMDTLGLYENNLKSKNYFLEWGVGCANKKDEDTQFQTLMTRIMSDFDQPSDGEEEKTVGEFCRNQTCYQSPFNNDAGCAAGAGTEKTYRHGSSDYTCNSSLCHQKECCVELQTCEVAARTDSNQNFSGRCGAGKIYSPNALCQEPECGIMDCCNYPCTYGGEDHDVILKFTENSVDPNSVSTGTIISNITCPGNSGKSYSMFCPQLGAGRVEDRQDERSMVSNRLDECAPFSTCQQYSDAYRATNNQDLCGSGKILNESQECGTGSGNCDITNCCVEVNQPAGWILSGDASSTIDWWNYDLGTGGMQLLIDVERATGVVVGQSEQMVLNEELYNVYTQGCTTDAILDPLNNDRPREQDIIDILPGCNYPMFIYRKSENRDTTHIPSPELCTQVTEDMIGDADNPTDSDKPIHKKVPLPDSEDRGKMYINTGYNWCLPQDDPGPPLNNPSGQTLCQRR